MANTATADSMVTRVRESIDDLGSVPTNTTETILRWLNEGGQELHNLFVASYEEYMRERVTITFDGRTPPEYPLPDDFLKSLGMDYVVSTTDRRRMEKFQNAERNTRQNGVLTAPPSLYGVPQYRIIGNVVEIIPNPSSGTAELFYVPEFKPLRDGEAVKDRWPYVREGQETYAVIHAQYKAAQREEADVRPFLAEKQAKQLEIMTALKPRDAAESWRITDTQGVAEAELKWWW